MEDGARLKLIILGLVLAAIAGAYLFFSGRFASKTNTNQVSRNIVSTPQPSPTSPGLDLPPGIPLQSDVQQLPPTGGQLNPEVSSLPSTGLPVELIGSIGAAGIVIGYALRRFPK